MLNNFKAFMADKKAWDMYITGRGGTGKTTDLKHQVQYCIDSEIPYVVLAFTHKACGVLREKLPDGSIIATLHSFLKKRPGINKEAAKKKHVDITIQHGQVEAPKIIFIDEYSIVGERDLMSVRELQDDDYDGVPGVKVCWLGDPYQLPPVGDAESVVPYGAYSYTLTHNYRRGNGNPLSEPIDMLVSFIEGTPAQALPESGSFVRGIDIVQGYMGCRDDKVLLAYTNRRVQQLNALCQGYETPVNGDTVFSPTTKQRYTYLRDIDATEVYQLDKPFGEVLPLNTKYRTLEHLLTMDVKFAEVTNEDGELMVVAYTFGHQDAKDEKEELKNEAVAANAEIEKRHKVKSAFWAKNNPRDRLARRRSKAWRDFLTHDECVICLDFAHAMTTHKAQGSTYHTVFIDTDDLSIAMQRDYKLYMRLFYVAMSRATTKVITN